MVLFNPTMGEAIGMASNQPTSINLDMESEEKQKRMELLTLVKAHADLIVATLLIAYLGYSIYVLNKQALKK